MELEEIISGFVQHSNKNKLDYKDPQGQSFTVYFPKIIPGKGFKNFFRAQGTAHYSVLEKKHLVWISGEKQIEIFSIKKRAEDITKTPDAVLFGPRVESRKKAHHHLERLKKAYQENFNSENIEIKPTQSLIEELIPLIDDIHIHEKALSQEKRQEKPDYAIIRTYKRHLNEARYRISELTPILELRLQNKNIFTFLNYFLSNDTPKNIKSKEIVMKYNDYLMSLHFSRYELAKKIEYELKSLMKI
ncbi:MAG TPA: hypothetical protein VJJ23_03845 [Candidatus Nanoarchaeia archaeon]|nr:hypothetical protein [Candidatus Nanoarchaeia archaeon]